LIQVLAAHRRPGSPNYGTHYRGLPEAAAQPERFDDLVSILLDDALPDTVRDHAGGALGEVGDGRAVPFLIDALSAKATRRGAATALGRLRSEDARTALEGIAPSLRTAAWALAELSPPGDVGEIIEKLSSGQLRSIRPTLEKLDGATLAEVARRARDHLEAALAAHEHLSPHRWAITALHQSRDGESAPLLAEGLHQFAERRDLCIHACDGETVCSCVPSRLLKALGAFRDLDSVPAIIDAIEVFDDPIQVERAAVQARKIVEVHGETGRRLARADARRLRQALDRLRAELRKAPPVEASTPWDNTIGTEPWRRRVNRASIAIERLLETVDA